MAKDLIYFADPMCSWCWGFAPVIGEIARAFGGETPMRIVMGGLYAGNTQVMDDESKRTIREHWEHVHQASGQPFDLEFFGRQDFVYDTEPACRAVVAVRRIAPEKTLSFLDHLHQAFYAGNQNITDREVLCDLAESAGFERQAFAEAFDDPATAEETRTDFATAYHSGVTGFPTLIAGEDGRYALVTQGFQTLEKIKPVIAAWSAGKIHIEEPAESAGQ